MLWDFGSPSLDVSAPRDGSDPTGRQAEGPAGSGGNDSTPGSAPLAERVVLYEALLDASRDALVVSELSGAGDDGPRIVYVSRAFCERTGWTSREVVGLPSRLLLAPGADLEALQRIGAAVSAGRSVREELMTRYKDGSPHWSELAIHPLRDERGTVTRYVAVVRDVTTRRLVEAERADRDAFVQSVLASLPARTAVLDGDGTITAVNRAWKLFWRQSGGTGPSSVVSVLPGATPGAGPNGVVPQVGVNYVDICAAVAAGGGCTEIATRVAQGVRAVLTGRVDGFTLDYEVHQVPPSDAGDDDDTGSSDASGTGRWFQVQVVPLSGRPGAVVAHTEITARKRTEAALAYQAGHDPLTGLLNRAGLLQAMGEGMPPGGGPASCLLFTDLDGFKSVNDGLGHAAGDEVLVEVTRRLRAVAGNVAIARLGGDEFAVLLHGCGRARACTLAVRLIEALREPFDVAGLRLTVSASVGVALADPTHRTPGDLLRDADAAMYEAKARGRDRFAVFDSQLRQRALRRVTMLHRLRHALTFPAETGLCLHYQPVVSLTDRRVLGLEALARWTDDTLGEVAPTEFIAVAEESGLIAKFGQWALERACLDGARTGLQVSVNVSARQLADARIVDVVERALDVSRLPAHRLCLELTESAVLADVDAALVRLGLLRRRGVQVALDDFGTGWSSLGQLRRLPVDRLKVDRSFVEALGRDGGATAVVSAIVALARGLGMRVTAEGVETEDQFARLRDLGCDDAQGYRLGLPAALAVSWDGSARYVVRPAPDPSLAGGPLPTITA